MSLTIYNWDFQPFKFLSHPEFVAALLCLCSVQHFFARASSVVIDERLVLDDLSSANQMQSDSLIAIVRRGADFITDDCS